MENKESRVILAYHMDPLMFGSLQAEMNTLGIPVRPVTGMQENAPIGLLAGVTGWKAGGPAPEAKELDEPMIVMCGLGSKGLDSVLLQLRKKKMTIRLKAVMTPTNMCWNGRQLQTELKRERAALPRK